jgi:hypothetical protein
VNAYLLKAERALSQGKPEEARVHAWNALTTIRAEELGRLLEVARELDDGLLIRDIELRGVPLEEPEPRVESKSSRIAFVWFALVIAVVAGAALSSALGEPGAIEPKREDTTTLPQTEPLLTQRSGVWLVRLGRSERAPLQKLADDMTFRYGIPVGVLPEIVLLPRSVLDEEREQIDGDALLDVLARWYPARGRATVIGVTDYSMFSDALDLRYPFMLRDHGHHAVVSTADLGANLVDRWRGRSRYKRTRKLIARGIGFLYLRRSMSDDSHSLMRSQMSGTDDIDALDERL